MCHDDCPFPVQGGAPIGESDIEIDLLDGKKLPIFLTVPDGESRGALLLIHDIHGPNAFYHDLARRLAHEGFVTALPDLFFRIPPAEENTPDGNRARGRLMEQASALQDLKALSIWLRHHEAANEKVGTIGFCMGGTLVLLLASRDPIPVASVCYYGFPKRERTPLQPILPIDVGEVANLQSPLLGFWGDQDTGVGPENVDAYSDQLMEAAKSHDFITYTGIGHGFLTFDPNAAAYDESADSWERTLDFFKREFAR
jgi:carboxymethylenebutenolidase